MLAALGTPWSGLGSISPIEVVIFVLVIGEEIGWRGFLQPRLRARFGLLESSLITGIVWVPWHLPVYLLAGTGPGAYLVFVWWVMPVAVTIGAVAERSGYSVLVATVMHGAANIALPIVLPGVDRAAALFVSGAAYLVVAVILSRRSQAATPAQVRRLEQLRLEARVTG